MRSESRPPVRFLADPAGRSVAHSSHGRGPLLVCPAWWVSHLERDWDTPGYRAFFEALGEHATVVRYDRPGVGMSDPDPSERTLADEVALLDAVIRHYGGDRVSLLGISSGGPPAIVWTADHPDRVERLILYGTYADGAQLAPEDLQRALGQLVRAHWGAGALALSDVFVPGGTPAQREEFTTLQRHGADAETAARFLELTYAMRVTDRLADVRAPTHVVHRRGDRAAPYACGAALAKAIEGAELVTLAGRIHVPWFGEDVVRAIVDVVRGLTPRPSAPAECALDHGNRELVREGERVPLTPLEYGLMKYLAQHAGRAVSRDELVERVWDQQTAGSNVVDAVVRTLRRKLGPFAPSVETVKGVGYRFRAWARATG